MSIDPDDLHERKLRARNKLIGSAIALILCVPLIGYRIFRVVDDLERLSGPARPDWLGFDPSDRNALNAFGPRGKELVSQVDITRSIFDIYGTIPPESCRRFRMALAEALTQKPINLEVGTALLHLDKGLAARGCR